MKTTVEQIDLIAVRWHQKVNGLTPSDATALVSHKDYQKIIKAFHSWREAHCVAQNSALARGWLTSSLEDKAKAQGIS